MKYFDYIKTIIQGFLLTLLITSCIDDDAVRNFNLLEVNKTNDGIFILNEGNFNYSNASLSYYDPETKEVLNDVFFNVNGLPLGDVAQSMNVQDSLAYIVINNSGKVYIINTNNFKFIGKITGLTSPRYIHFINDHKAYISDLYARSITVVDPVSNVIIDRINVSNKNPNFNQHSTEQMLAYKNLVFTNCWSLDNKILVIDSQQDKLIDSIEVSIQPNSMVFDSNNKLWVLSDGGFSGNSYGHSHATLSRIDPDTRIIEQTFIFDNLDASPSNLRVHNGKLFFIYSGSGGANIPNSGIFQMDINSTELPQTPVLASTGKNFYGLDINPLNGDFFITDAGNYTERGIAYRYDKEFKLIHSFKVGITPNKSVFK